MKIKVKIIIASTVGKDINNDKWMLLLKNDVT